jgi:hypothetical protein
VGHIITTAVDTIASFRLRYRSDIKMKRPFADTDGRFIYFRESRTPIRTDSASLPIAKHKVPLIRIQ